jgi:ACS family hexuronate transporter-like MFS transporter
VQPRVSWWRLLTVPEVWGMVLGKACCDAVWFTAFFAHLSFSTLVITLPADMVPRAIVGSVVRLVGFGGPMGGVLFNKFAGSLLEGIGRGAGYPLLFTVGSTFHVVGFLWILLTIRNIRPIALFEGTSSPALVSVQK